MFQTPSVQARSTSCSIVEYDSLVLLDSFASSRGLNSAPQCQTKLILRSKATCDALGIDRVGMWIEEAGRRCRSKEKLATGADDAFLAFATVAEACSDDSARIDGEMPVQLTRECFVKLSNLSFPRESFCATLTVMWATNIARCRSQQWCVLVPISSTLNESVILGRKCR